jgi:hypothetical protein
MGTLAGIAHAVEFSWMTHLSNEGAAEESLKIERDIGLEPGCLVQPGEEMARHAEAAKVAPWKNVNVVDGAIAAQERSPFRIYDPGDGGLRICVANKSGRGQGVNDVA